MPSSGKLVWVQGMEVKKSQEAKFVFVRKFIRILCNTRFIFERAEDPGIPRDVSESLGASPGKATPAGPPRDMCVLSYRVINWKQVG